MKQNEPHLHDLTGAYALNALSDDEREAFEAHLDICPPCAEETAELLATTTDLGGMLSEPPPERLRASVMAEIERTPQEVARPAAGHGDTTASNDNVVALRRPDRDDRGVAPWIAWAGAAAAAAVAVVAVVLGLQLAEANQQLDEVATAREQMSALLAAPDARTLVVEDEQVGEVRLVVSAERGQAMLIASDMEPAPHEHIYEAWVIRDEEVATAGLFDADPDGRVTTLIEGDFTTASAIGVTIEPDGGSPEPTTDPVMVVPLSG